MFIAICFAFKSSSHNCHTISGLGKKQNKTPGNQKWFGNPTKNVWGSLLADFRFKKTKAKKKYNSTILLEIKMAVIFRCDSHREKEVDQRERTGVKWCLCFFNY